MGLLLAFGGILGFLPIFGFWMLPIGLALLAEDIPPLRSGRSRILDWIEHRRPKHPATEPIEHDGEVDKAPRHRNWLAYGSRPQ